MQTSDDTIRTNFTVNLIIQTVLLLVITAALVGGLVWYYMNQSVMAQEDSYNRTVKSKSTEIAVLNNKIIQSQNDSTKPTDTLTKLRAYCQVANNDAAVTSLSYMETTNGVYGNCGIGGNGGGAMLISMELSGVWTKIWEGNGTISKATCDQYKIPNKMSGGTCNY